MDKLLVTNTHVFFGSKTIKTIYYKVDTKNLIVRFDNGSLYSYEDVEFKTFNDFTKADSAGEYLAHNIKHKYKYSNITGLYEVVTPVVDSEQKVEEGFSTIVNHRSIIPNDLVVVFEDKSVLRVDIGLDKDAILHDLRLKASNGGGMGLMAVGDQIINLKSIQRMYFEERIGV